MKKIKIKIYLTLERNFKYAFHRFKYIVYMHKISSKSVAMNCNIKRTIKFKFFSFLL